MNGIFFALVIKKIMELRDKVAIVTGASSGIGRAIAREMNDSGVRVVLASRERESLEEVKDQLNGECMIMPTDVTDTDQVQDLADATLKKYGRIDILINNAGIMPLSYLKNTHIHEWLSMVDVNIRGVMNGTYAVLPAMKKQQSGHIVNIASVDGKELYPGGAVYGATKAAIIAFSQGMRMELSPEFNIRVTCVEPGTVDTNLRQTITDEELLQDKDYDDPDEPKLEPEDIARSVLFALSEPDGVNINELLIKPTQKA